MNLEPYYPFSDRTLVYQSSKDIIDQIDGIVTTFLLALLNQYQFKIGNLSNTSIHEIFTSPVDWWEDSWMTERNKRGVWNLRYYTTEDEFALANILLYKKLPYSQVIHVHCDDNLTQNILSSSLYNEFIEKFEVGQEGSVYKEVFKNIFYGFEGIWEENFKHLQTTFFGEENRLAARVLTNESLEKLSTLISQTNPKQVLISTKEIQLLSKLRSGFPDVKFLHITDITNENYTETVLSTIKLFYELMLFIDTDNKFLEEDDKFSDIVRNCEN